VKREAEEDWANRNGDSWWRRGSTPRGMNIGDKFRKSWAVELLRDTLKAVQVPVDTFTGPGYRAGTFSVGLENGLGHTTINEHAHARFGSRTRKWNLPDQTQSAFPQEGPH
jgi:hypothetical protein